MQYFLYSNVYFNLWEKITGHYHVEGFHFN